MMSLSTFNQLHHTFQYRVWTSAPDIIMHWRARWKLDKTPRSLKECLDWAEVYCMGGEL